MKLKTISISVSTSVFFILEVFAPTISPEVQWKQSLRRDTYIGRSTSTRPSKPSQAGRVHRGLLPEQIQRRQFDRFAKDLINLLEESFDQAYPQDKRPAQAKVRFAQRPQSAQQSFASSSESGVASKSQTHTPSTTLKSTRSVVITPEVAIAPQEAPRPPSVSTERISTPVKTLTRSSSGGFLAQEPQRAGSTVQAAGSTSSFSVQLTDFPN